MRETRNAQGSIFDLYAAHEHGRQLNDLSDLLDAHVGILSLVEQDLRVPDTSSTGACGLSVESVFRCLLLKQITGAGYRKLAFHLSDSGTYRCFARLDAGQMPSRSGLQSTIRRIGPDTLEQINRLLMANWVKSGTLSVDALRIDSTVVESNILEPRDSQLLDDGVRVLSRMMLKCKHQVGVRLRIVDQRKRSKSLAFRIFYAKFPEKQALYPELLRCATLVIRQVDRAFETIGPATCDPDAAQKWIEEATHYRALLLRVIDQTQRRIYKEEKVPPSEKIVSLFEEHTDIIVKGKRDVLFGHKVNLATQENGFITYFNIEDGNPADSALYLPVLADCQKEYGRTPSTIVADGCYVSQSNVEKARELGVKRTVFNKPAGLTFAQMGIKSKTFTRWRDFRAGVEGNISELKRAFGAGKARWKRKDGFSAFVWSSVLSFNLIRMVRFSSG